MTPIRISSLYRALLLNICCLLFINAEASSVLLTGAGGLFSVKVTNFKDYPFKHVVKQAYDYSCGSAAVATLLTYHFNHPVDEQAVLDAMLAAGDQAKIRREGFSLLDMKRYLDATGYLANGYRISLDKLAQVEIPAIALIDTEGYLHFVVIKGADQAQVLIGDPAIGIATVTRAKFDTMWKNRILFVVQKIRSTNMTGEFNLREEWDAVPRAPLALAVSRQALANFILLLPNTNDF